MAQKTAREIVVDILLDIEKDSSYINIALRQTIEKHEYLISKDKNLITEIVNGTVKYERRIDYIINQFSKVKVKKMKPLIRTTIRMSVYQLVFLDKIPNSAVCNEAVKIIKKRKMGGLSGFVNGVLRNIARNLENIKYPDCKKQPLQYLAIFYSFPDWIIKMWLDEYSFEEVRKTCEYLNTPAEISIRVNTAKTSKDKLIDILKEEEVSVKEGYVVNEALIIKSKIAIPDLPSFKQGLFTVQGESSMLASIALAPKSGDMVLDVCSAPGGKSTHIAEIMQNKGIVIASDIYSHKIELIEETSKRLGHNIIKANLQDATKLNKDYINQFDKILVDAPCSGLGIMNKKADIRWNKEYNDIVELQKIQKSILKIASKYLKPKGILVYSTCTISSKENEDVVEWAVKNLDLDLEDVYDYLPQKLKDNKNDNNFIQIMPNEYNLDGFFISRLRKRG